MATYKEIEKQMASMRKDVLAWKKEWQNENGRFHRVDSLQNYFESFEGTFKAARSVLLRPENEFPAASKRLRLDTFFSELQGFYASIRFCMRPKPELKKETEIKQQEPSENSFEKKETEIKEGQLSISIRGGRRSGAGRKSLGLKKTMSITLSEESWNEIDISIQKGKYKSYSDFFRSLAP